MDENGVAGRRVAVTVLSPHYRIRQSAVAIQFATQADAHIALHHASRWRCWL